MDYLAIIARIEARLKQIKMGKMEFYQEMGISPNSFSLWKKGETKPTNENLEKAAEILRCSLEELMFGEKEKAPTLSGEDSIFADKFSQLDEADKAYISGQIDALLSKHG